MLGGCKTNWIPSLKRFDTYKGSFIEKKEISTNL